MSDVGDPIAAIATAPGRGGIGVVRVSGRDLSCVIDALCGRALVPRTATLLPFRAADGGAIDTGLALFFPAPHSYTGEDVLELQGHGGPVVMQLLLARCLEAAAGIELATGRPLLPGLRLAEPGEFTQRAFLNDKIDLAQAEAIADLIDAGSRGAARAAMRSLQGEFSARVVATRAALTQLRIYVEAAIDFPEEEIDFLASRELAERVTYVRQLLDEVLQAARRGALLTRGMTVVIAGRPNAGKSTMMNALAGHDVAIVTPVPGTTRDPLSVSLDISGVPVELIDTAGLRDLQGEGDHDVIEAEGMRRARDAIARADHVLYVVDAAADPDAYSFAEECDTLPEGLPVTLVMNKSDIAVGVEDADRVS